MTVGALADNDVVRRRLAVVGESLPPLLSAEFREEDEDIAEAALTREWLVG